jgi:hypothetical protein
LDESHEKTAPPSPAAAISRRCPMKLLSKISGLTLFVLFALLLFAGPAAAEILLFQFGRFAVHLPLARVDTTYLYDFVTDDPDKSSRWGGETPLLDVPIPFTRETCSLVVGATTDTIRKGEPFLGFNKRVTAIVEQQFDVGLFAGKRMDSRDWMVGLKASLPLWGSRKE